WTAHQTVHNLRRLLQCPERMRAVVADIHGTVTARTRAFLDIKIDPCEDGPCRPTIRHGGATLVLQLGADSHRVPTITYAKRLARLCPFPQFASKSIGNELPVLFIPTGKSCSLCRSPLAVSLEFLHRFFPDLCGNMSKCSSPGPSS